MKKGIHPEYVECTVHCGCGETWKTRSTVSEIKVEICSSCHPFFRGGGQKVVDTMGRVDRFTKKFGSDYFSKAGQTKKKSPKRR
jgi:large subunit ribosomal protein L31